jgi:N-acetylglucosamine kinase-like BadF-type ATPase
MAQPKLTETLTAQLDTISAYAEQIKKARTASKIKKLAEQIQFAADHGKDTARMIQNRAEAI